MAYQAIYRKWRPQTFEDIIGQEHITKTLKNQIMTGRISHAYLFCGTRGTGKTTAAKVFAKAVNCLDPQNGSPCNKCAICKGISSGSILDVNEIDAASNNSVDNIRQIREDVNYVAAETKYSVYIIDEVHMLSGGAFNALLKTLEEPPAHVIFILATTEVHKIPETILSRCQRFDFKRITPSDIIIRMKEIAHADGIKITEDAYRLLASLANGSMRDGLSILERCISACGNDINENDITDVLGMAEEDLLFSAANAIISNDPERVIECISSVSGQGKDLNVFCDSLIKHIRDLMICKISSSPESSLDHSAETIVRLKSMAERATYEKLSNAASLLTKAKADAKWVKDPRVIYELALIKMTKPELDESPAALLDRLASVEEAAKNGIVVSAASENKTEEKPAKKKTEPSGRLFVPLDVSSLTSESPVVAVARNWDNIASSIARSLTYVSGLLPNRKITIDGEGIILLFSETEAMKKRIVMDHLEEIQNEFTNRTKTDLIIKTAFINEVEDVLIDYWSIPAPSGERANTADNRSALSDPIDRISADFSEIVEVDDTPIAETSAEQTGLFDDEMQGNFRSENEEFLEESEQEQMTNINYEPAAPQAPPSHDES